MYEYKATVQNVVDGDTFDLDIDLGFHIHIHERVRLLGADTPEKFGKEKPLGMIMKQYATDLLLGKEITIKSEKPQEAAKTDSFGRWLVSVIFEDGSDLTGLYTALGVNKYKSTYSEDSVRKLEK